MLYHTVIDVYLVVHYYIHLLGLFLYQIELETSDILLEFRKEAPLIAPLWSNEIGVEYNGEVGVGSLPSKVYRISSDLSKVLISITALAAVKLPATIHESTTPIKTFTHLQLQYFYTQTVMEYMLC